MNQQQLYARLPVLLQHAACSWYGMKEARVRLGDEFRRYLEFLTTSERWSAGDIAAYQDEKLRDLVAYAYARVPFYRERLKAAKVSPADIRGRADLPKLPILKKEDVRADFAKLCADNVAPRELLARHTSGTTGKSLDFYLTRSGFAMQVALWWRWRRRFGVDVSDWHANFTGKLVVPPEQKSPPYWRWNYGMRQALLTMHHMTPDKVGAIADFLDQHRFALFTGYPSILHAFALSMQEIGRKLAAPPRIVTTGAENTYERQRRDIEAVTRAPIAQHYGLSEGCGAASECEHFRYHEDFEFGIVECADPEILEDGSTRGKILCTGFANPAFPFIRYEVGDVGVWSPPAQRCSCGRESAVLASIEGRTDDYVLTPEGRRIMRFDYLFKETVNVREAQIVQREPGEIVIRVVRRPGFGSADEEHIRNEVHEWISPRLLVRFEFPAEIEKTAAGKFRAVVSELPNDATLAMK